MVSFARSSLINRLILLAIIVFAISIPLFWFLFSASVTSISRDVVDTRMLEFADQVRAYRASLQTLAPEHTDEETIESTQTGLGGPDIEWIWQISNADTVSGRSELLRLVDAQISATITKPDRSFIFSNRQTPLGDMRIAERLIDEPTQIGEKDVTRSHYLVGLTQTRYKAYVQDHADRLQDLAFVGVIIMSGGILAMLAIFILLTQRQLAGVKTALAQYEKGDTEGIEGYFPSEIQTVIDLMNDLLLRNQKLIERTRKYVSKITHDINHPLAILKNGLKGDIDLELLNRQISRMAGLVDRYASLARAIGPEGETKQKIDVSASIKDTADGFSILYRRNPLSIICHVEENLTFIIPQHDLEAVISNLVSNAHKYAETEIHISAHLHDTDLEIIVEDDGPGIPAEKMQTALNWGKRLDEAPPGTGFGLSIVTDIMDLYSGSITLSQSDLGGLAATVRFPSTKSRLVKD